MKNVKLDLPQDLENLEVEIFSDIHLGSPKCDYHSLKDRIERVRDNKNVYCIVLGDLCNNSTKTSVGDTYTEELTPMQQVQRATELFRPIKDKILGVTSGNHERRSYKQDGVDLMYFFANELGVADRYDYTACLLFIRFGSSNFHATRHRRIPYSLYMTHGDGQGGRTMGGKANGLQRRGQIVDADIIVTGHTHAPMTFKDAFYRIDYANSRAKLVEQTFVNASSTLDYEAYAELYGMKPNSKSSPIILLNGSEKQVMVSC